MGIDLYGRQASQFEHQNVDKIICVSVKTSNKVVGDLIRRIRAWEDSVPPASLPLVSLLVSLTIYQKRLLFLSPSSPNYGCSNANSILSTHVVFRD